MTREEIEGKTIPELLALEYQILELQLIPIAERLYLDARGRKRQRYHKTLEVLRDQLLELRVDLGSTDRDDDR